jgi:prepilin signal peptidase PulO-like enzyme (type II secretory pathway)
MNMEENKSSFMKSSLYWGVILGVVLIIYSLLLYFVDLSYEKWVSWISYVIFIGGIIISTISYRNNELGGTITYGQALGFGTMVILFAAVISAIYSFIFMQFIDPGSIDKILQMAEEQMIERGIPEDQIEMGLEMQRKFMKPWLISLISVPGSVLFGFIFTLITSIFIQKKKAEIPFEN